MILGWAQAEQGMILGWAQWAGYGWAQAEQGILQGWAQAEQGILHGWAQAEQGILRVRAQAEQGILHSWAQAEQVTGLKLYGIRHDWVCYSWTGAYWAQAEQGVCGWARAEPTLT